MENEPRLSDALLCHVQGTPNAHHLNIDDLVADLRDARREIGRLTAGLEDIRSRISPHYGISAIKLRAIIERLIGREALPESD